VAAMPFSHVCLRDQSHRKKSRRNPLSQVNLALYGRGKYDKKTSLQRCGSLKMSLIRDFEIKPKNLWPYWVSMIPSNMALFLFSFQLKKDVFSHQDESFFLWIIPLVFVAGLAALVLFSESSLKKFGLICIFNLLFWSRVFFEIASMEPCFEGRRPIIAFWMAPYYNEPP
jgi:hypothetical protein